MQAEESSSGRFFLKKQGMSLPSRRRCGLRQNYRCRTAHRKQWQYKNLPLIHEMECRLSEPDILQNSEKKHLFYKKQEGWTLDCNFRPYGRSHNGQRDKACRNPERYHLDRFDRSEKNRCEWQSYRKCRSAIRWNLRHPKDNPLQLQTDLHSATYISRKRKIRFSAREVRAGLHEPGDRSFWTFLRKHRKRQQGY